MSTGVVLAILNVPVLVACLGTMLISLFQGSLDTLLIVSDILLAELQAIYQGFSMVRALGISNFVCYSDSLHSVSLINGPPQNFHAYATLIHDIKDLINLSSSIVFHTLREGNHCADFLAKMGAAADAVLMFHDSAPEELLSLIREDACGTFFPRG